MTKLTQGAWINAHTGQWSFIDEHSNWAKRPGNLESLGILNSVWEAVRDIPNDYAGPNREAILRTVMASGGIRMRCHGSVIVFECTCGLKVALPACREVLRDIAGELTLCRFTDLNTNETVEVLYADYVAQKQDPS